MFITGGFFEARLRALLRNLLTKANNQGSAMEKKEVHRVASMTKFSVDFNSGVASMS